MPDLPGALLLAVALAAAEPRDHQGQRLGLEQPARPRLVRCSPPLLTAVFVRQLAAPPRAARRPGAAAHPVVRTASAGHRPGRPRLLRLPADQHPVAPVRLGVRRAAGGPGAGAGRAGGRGRGRPARAARGARGLPGPGRPGCAGVGRRLPLVPPAGRASSRRSGPSGCPARSCPGIGVGRHPAAARQRGPRRGARAAATRRRRPSSPAPGSSAACWASRSSS